MHETIATYVHISQGFKMIRGLRNLGIPKELEAWRQRIGWIRRQQQSHSASLSPESQKDLLPDLSDEALVLTAGNWLKPYLSGVRSKADLAKLDWKV